ncbi:MAG: UDP-N-acetylglucosamine 2-epimerase (non-hydrolyzing) [Candidatus Marinimicrobia bacterium]|nr:UDP-N-acetylglucosamine 2-epimerase (non-hydrolyzing) [Candidatus Neomarinimicrobiota bacterium]
MKKIISVVGARPNFIKIAPLYREFQKHKDKVQHLICHTGQHFDKKMSDIFFKELKLPIPDFHLGIGGGSHTEQTAKIMLAFEKILIDEKPDLIIVVGDVNSTLACSLVAKKLSISIAHVESGLRSFDREMPEEINRILTDVIADYLFVSEKSGLKNLQNEGIDKEKVFFVGNIMIDSLVNFLQQAEKSNIMNELQVDSNDYILVTFHRPRNVDTEMYLNKLVKFLNNIADKKKVVFPIHPRTEKNMKKYGFSFNDNVISIEPVGYIDFLTLMRNAFLVVTDSGGIQEETTYLGVQCITVRDNTERPSTVEIGTNQLIGTDLNRVEIAVNEILAGKTKKGNIPELWDGKTAGRIVGVLM